MNAQYGVDMEVDHFCEQDKDVEQDGYQHDNDVDINYAVDLNDDQANN